MAIVKVTVSGRSGVASWLNANAAEYFVSVTYSSQNYTLTAKDLNNRTVFTLNSTGINIYKSASVYDSMSFSTESSGDYTIVKCGGGILIMTSGTHTNVAHIIITKTNDGTVAVIAGGASARANALTQNIRAAAWGDAEDATKTLTFTPSAQNQTRLIEFMTYAAPDTVRYTPTAFYMPVGENYDVSYGKFTVDGRVYITNGYWAIEDTEVAA